MDTSKIVLRIHKLVLHDAATDTKQAQKSETTQTHLTAMDVLLTDQPLKLAGYVPEAVQQQEIPALNALLVCIKMIRQTLKIAYLSEEMDLRPELKSETIKIQTTETDETAIAHRWKQVGSDQAEAQLTKILEFGVLQATTKTTLQTHRLVFRFEETALKLEPRSETTQTQMTETAAKETEQ